MSADRSIMAIILPSRSRCSAYLDAWLYNPACNEIVDWSITQSCSNEKREREGTAEMAEFNAGLQTRQEERYVIWLFLLLLGGSLTRFSRQLQWPFPVQP